jgi:exodeoxyribonuclease VII small subunit
MSDTITFEKAMERLEEIVTLLENGKCPLDESMKLFDEGTKLIAHCSETLKTAEQAIIHLTGSQTEV